MDVRASTNTEQACNEIIWHFLTISFLDIRLYSNYKISLEPTKSPHFPLGGKVGQLAKKMLFVGLSPF